MDAPLPNLSTEQWMFLSVLDAFDGPIPIDVAGTLAPLLPGPLFDLLDKCKKHGIIRKIDDRHFCLSNMLPKAVRQRLNAINTARYLKGLCDQVYEKNMDHNIGDVELLNLLNKAGRIQTACETEIRLAHRAYDDGDLERSRKLLSSAVARLHENRHTDDLNETFITATLDLSNVCFAMGQGFKDTEPYLITAEKIAQQSGNLRLHAMINLHLGRLFYFSDRRKEALASLSHGINHIEELGDDDILAQSAVFIGIFYFIKGLFKDAVKYFDKAEQVYESDKKGILINPTTPLFLGYCASYLGQFHRAIGSLDFNWRLAVERSDYALSSSIRAVLGTILVLLKKDREASAHLHHAINEAAGCDNAFGLYFALGGVALQHFMAGRSDEAVKYLKLSTKEGRRAGLVRQFASPWFLEMFCELHRMGYQSFSEIEFPDALNNILNGVNIHLRGVALRLKAKMDLAGNTPDINAALSDLNESRHLLEQSGDPIQLAKTVLEIAGIEMRQGKRGEARRLTYHARKLMGGYVEEFFPPEFNHLIGSDAEASRSGVSQENFLKKYIEMIESLYPSDSPQEIFANVLIATSRMFEAERSGLFWFPSGKYTTRPELRASVNLTKNKVREKGFEENLSFVLRAFKTNQHQMGRPHAVSGTNSGQSVRSVLCIPIEVNNQVTGVYYYDNSYLDDAFDFLDPVTMKQMANHTNLVIERRLNFLKIMEERDFLASEKSIRLESESDRILYRSGIMKRVLDQADQVSRTESTIVILGETGTGKELLAKRIHRHSGRSDGPFIVVDSTTIPENLVESELFGHEKGAFTGADKRKIGRIELAHRGTLFLDEIGELPLPAQSKLLRTLQEKEFSRVGGTRTLKSDFRLIAATNRDLSAEVEKGRFRKDLYFRLNVIPIQLPPLRERIDDIIVLADHFLEHYARRYQRKDLLITPELEKILVNYKWPGNVRELKNVIERAVLLSRNDFLELNLPMDHPHQADHPFADTPSLDELQRRYIAYILRKTNGKISGPNGAADLLGMKRTSLYSRMRTLGMRNSGNS